jgi:sugar phosphate isomerase/epimerase
MCRFLRKDILNGIREDELYQEIVRLRKSLGRNHLQQVITGLDELCSRFPRIRFCIETRIHYYEIPIPDELDKIFAALPRKNLGYWHDIGHTWVQDRLGFIPMETWQDRFDRRCGGLHIHDVESDLTDHLPPGEGMLDLYEILKRFDPFRSLFTLEINARSEFEKVLNGIRSLREKQLEV